MVCEFRIGQKIHTIFVGVSSPIDITTHAEMSFVMAAVSKVPIFDLWILNRIEQFRPRWKVPQTLRWKCNADGRDLQAFNLKPRSFLRHSSPEIIFPWRLFIIPNITLLLATWSLTYIYLQAGLVTVPLVRLVINKIKFTKLTGWLAVSAKQIMTY